MSQEPLKNLHDQLNRLETDNADMRSRADALRARVEQAMADDQHRETLLESLEEAFVAFESDHPRIATAIRQAIDVLSTSGI